VQDTIAKIQDPRQKQDTGVAESGKQMKINEIANTPKLSSNNVGDRTTDIFYLKNPGLEENLTEALDSPYPYKWVDQEDYEWEAVAPLPSGLDLRIRFEKDRDNIWDIEFLLGRTLRATGEGDQYRIFATVVKAVTEWIKWLLSSKQPVNAIKFSAIKDDEQETGRARLYDRFAKQLSNSIHFDYKNIGKGLVTKFILSNPNYKKVEENFADGEVKGKSRPGRVKAAGASCDGSVTELRTKAKNASGEKAKMYHWCANMKAGKK
jgi:hypothetical protein